MRKAHRKSNVQIYLLLYRSEAFVPTFTLSVDVWKHSLLVWDYITLPVLEKAYSA